MKLVTMMMMMCCGATGFHRACDERNIIFSVVFISSFRGDGIMYTDRVRAHISDIDEV